MRLSMQGSVNLEFLRVHRNRDFTHVSSPPHVNSHPCQSLCVTANTLMPLKSFLIFCFLFEFDKSEASKSSRFNVKLDVGYFQQSLSFRVLCILGKV